MSTLKQYIRVSQEHARILVANRTATLDTYVDSIPKNEECNALHAALLEQGYTPEELKEAHDKACGVIYGYTL